MIFFLPVLAGLASSVIGGIVKKNQFNAERKANENAVREGYQMRKSMDKDERNYDRWKTNRTFKHELGENKRGFQRTLRLTNVNNRQESNMSRQGFEQAGQLSAQDFGQNRTLQSEGISMRGNEERNTMRAGMENDLESKRRTGAQAMQAFQSFGKQRNVAGGGGMRAMR